MTRSLFDFPGLQNGSGYGVTDLLWKNAVPSHSFRQSGRGAPRLAQPLLKRKSGVLPVIWTITDERWPILEPVLLEDAPPRAMARPRGDGRTILNGTLFRLRSECPWNTRPSGFGEDSTVHRGFPRWSKTGVMERLSAAMATRGEEPGAVFWKWPAAEGALGQARFGGKDGAKPDRSVGVQTGERGM